MLQPWTAYSQKQASVLTEVTEPSHEFYPSVTICAGHDYAWVIFLLYSHFSHISFRGNGKDIRKILDEEEENHNKSKLSPEEVPKILGRQ